MKFMRTLVLFGIISLCLLYTSDLFARGGGGGRSGGGGGGFGGGGYGGGYYHGYYYGYGGAYHSHPYDPVVNTLLIIGTAIFFGVIFFGVTFLIVIRNRTAKKALKKAASADSFWDEKKMLEDAKEVFFQVQEAWSKNDLTGIFHLVTNDFFVHYQHFLARYSKAKMKNIIKDIEIEKSSIVKVIDKSNDNEDTFLIYFKGKLIDYLVNTQSGIIIDGDKDIPDSFEDIYVFFRRDDKWLLNQIINDPESGYMKMVKENKG
jgi:hypothetical protein